MYAIASDELRELEGVSTNSAEILDALADGIETYARAAIWLYKTKNFACLQEAAEAMPLGEFEGVSRVDRETNKALWVADVLAGKAPIMDVTVALMYCARAVTEKQQAENQDEQCRIARRAPKTSEYRGVSFHSCRNRFRAAIREGKRNRHLGLFKTAEEAAAAYDTAAMQIYGERAKTNRSMGLL